VRAPGSNPREARLEYLTNLCQFETGLFAIGIVSDYFARQRAFDENHFSLGMSNAAAFLIEGFYYYRTGHSHGAGCSNPVSIIAS
jgi:hypothetical protein